MNMISDTAAKTCFQESAPFETAFDVGGDLALVYGVDASLHQRMKDYAAQGYRVGVMTALSWGNYGDYFSGAYLSLIHI